MDDSHLSEPQADALDSARPPAGMAWHWIPRRAVDSQLIALCALLIGGAVLMVLVGDILAPLIAAVVVAYLLEGPAGALERRGVPRLSAVLIVFTAFVAFLLVAVIALLPLLIQQLIALVQQLPAMVGEAQRALIELPERYPKFVSREQVNQLIDALQMEAFGWGQYLLSRTVSSLVVVAMALVYLFLVPFLVFFLLKDQKRIVAWLVGFLPGERQLATQVWREVDAQLSNYARGKFWEVLVVAATSCVAFVLLDLEYALLLGVASGLSLLVPYIGVIATAVPVAAVAYFQWGLQPSFFYVATAYAAIHMIDGNVLAPLMLSEATDLNPVAIVTAILLFGGIWGFWGLFFAVPLATIVQAVLRASAARRGGRRPYL